MTQITTQTDSPAASLVGSLREFALPDVLRLLAAGHHSGEVLVVAGGTDGRLWLRGGDLNGAAVRGTVGLNQAVFELSLVDDGWFYFTAGRAAPEPVPAVSVNETLGLVLPQVAEWRDLLRRVPLDATVHIAPAPPGANVQLTADQWQILAVVGSQGMRVIDLVAATGRDQVDTIRSVRTMADDGLVVLTVASQALGRVEAPPPPIEPYPARARHAGQHGSGAASGTAATGAPPAPVGTAPLGPAAPAAPAPAPAPAPTAAPAPMAAPAPTATPTTVSPQPAAAAPASGPTGAVLAGPQAPAGPGAAPSGRWVSTGTSHSAAAPTAGTGPAGPAGQPPASAPDAVPTPAAADDALVPLAMAHQMTQQRQTNQERRGSGAPAAPHPPAQGGTSSSSPSAPNAPVRATTPPARTIQSDPPLPPLPATRAEAEGGTVVDGPTSWSSAAGAGADADATGL